MLCMLTRRKKHQDEPEGRDYSVAAGAPGGVALRLGVADAVVLVPVPSRLPELGTCPGRIHDWLVMDVGTRMQPMKCEGSVRKGQT